MKDNLRAQLESIRTLSSQLNNLSDEMADTVGKVEHFLNVTCSVGIPAFVLVTETSSESKYLEYRRVGTEFRSRCVSYH